MYKARDNCWVNATEKLSARASSLGTPLSSTTISSTTETAPSTSTAVPAASGISNPQLGKILGAVLGSLAGIALLLVALLLLLRWKRKRRQYLDVGHQRRSSGIPDEKMDFADRGLPQTTSARHYRGHEQQASAGSISSMAILLGRVGHKRGNDKGNGSLVSDSSSQFNKEYKAAIGKPTPIQGEQAFRTLADPIADDKPILTNEERASVRRPRGNSRGGRRGSTRRSSGWNRYWSGGSALNILGFGKRESNRSSGSQYSDQRLPSQVTQSSAMVPPLSFARPEMQRVVSGSPTIRNGGNFPLPQEMKAKIERPGSVSTLSSYDDDRRDAFSSGIPASVHDDQSQQNAWTPIGHDYTTTRASSNVYSESNYPATIGRETMFPRPTQQSQAPQPSQQTSDMSWLNLGHQRGV